MKKWLLVASLGLVLGAPPAWPGEYGKAVKATPLIQTTTDSGGQAIRYPQTGEAELTVLEVEIPPGAETGWHRHPIPVYAYLLAGCLTVVTEGGLRREYRAGDVIVEVVDRAHNGVNEGDAPVKLIAFYHGVQGVPNVQQIPEPSEKP